MPIDNEVAPVADTEQLTAKLSEALNTAAECARSENAESYRQLAEKLAELETSAGRYLHTHTAYQLIVSKLQQDQPLTAGDFKTLRSLIIGDADDYLQYDDDFGQAKGELGRIIGEIRKLQSAEPSPETLMRLRVLCREAASALAPTVHYLEQRERVKNFEEHVRQPLSSDARRMLVQVIHDLAS
jgi:hypothetical protein